MIGLVNVRISNVHIPDLSVVNERYWKFKRNEHELEGVGYVCPACGNIRIVKPYVVDEMTGLATSD
jgi:hypothetical protein